MLVVEAVNNLSKFKINLSVLLLSVFAIQWCLLKSLTAAVFSPEYAVFFFHPHNAVPSAIYMGPSSAEEELGPRAVFLM